MGVLAIRLFRIRLFRVHLFRVRLFRVRLFRTRLFRVCLFRVHLFRVRLFRIHLFRVCQFLVCLFRVCRHPRSSLRHVSAGAIKMNVCDLDFQSHVIFFNIFYILDLEYVRTDTKIEFYSCLEPEKKKVLQKGV